MLKVVSTCQQISQSPWNSSPSKQLFTFGIGNRFKNSPSPACTQDYYNLPTTKTKRTCSFGVGTRFYKKLEKDIPPPGTYEPPSEFTEKKKGKMFSFGAKWSVYSKVYVKDKPNPDLTLPGPGTYKVIPDNFAYQARKITLKSRLKTSNYSFDMEIPGPEKYNIGTTFTKTGKQLNAKFHSSCAASFNPLRKTKSIVREKSPGPGVYNIKGTIDPKGHYFLSTYKSSLARTFSNLRRDTIPLNKTIIDNPGPGYYRTPSEFGFYEASDKYQKEYEKIDRKRAQTAVAKKRSRSVGKDIKSHVSPRNNNSNLFTIIPNATIV